jgi:hypothetical protein
MEQSMRCRYCDGQIELSNRTHLLHECQPLHEGYTLEESRTYAEVTPIARRAAVMTSISLLSKTPTARRVRGSKANFELSWVRNKGHVVIV